MNSCPSLPTSEELPSSEELPTSEELLNPDKYVEVDPKLLMPNENVIYFHPKENYIGCVKIIKIDKKENIKFMHKEGTINQSIVTEPIKLLKCKFFRKNFDREIYNETIAPVSNGQWRSLNAPIQKVFENEDLFKYIGRYIGGTSRRKSKTIKKRKNKNKRSKHKSSKRRRL